MKKYDVIFVNITS